MADTRPSIILDPHFRRIDELFSPGVRAELERAYRIVGGTDAPVNRADIVAALPDAVAYIAAHPLLTADEVAAAPNLRAVIEVSGSFREGLAYDALFARGIDVLSCAPGFNAAVGEMALAMLLACGRGLVDQHEKMRAGAGDWVDDRLDTDFSLRGARIGFVGFGAIARATCDVLAPFKPQIAAYDPWLTDAGPGVELASLDDILQQSQAVVVAASPTAENKHLINAERIAMMPRGSALVVISRAHLVDLNAAGQAAAKGHIRFATDVYDAEPIAQDDPLRSAPNVILSPHRAAAIKGGRHPIGDMILADLAAILTGRPERQLKPADPATLDALLHAPDVLAGQKADG